MSGLNLKGRRIMVTGAAGFIGFHLTSRLLGEGALVTGVDSMNEYYDVSLKKARLQEVAKYPSFRFECLDTSHHNEFQEFFLRTKPEIVIHLAAQAGVRYSLTKPREYISANIDGFLAVLEACRAHKVQHLIYASSSSVYGANRKVPFHEDDPVLEPVSLYAATKRAGELMAETYAHLFAIPASGLRFFTVYGPWGRPDMAYFSFTKAAFEGLTIDVFNFGKLKRDFTYIDDVIEAVVQLLDRPPESAAKTLGREIRSPHLIYNVGNHAPVELSEFIATIEAITGRKLAQRNLPMQAGDVPATFADVEQLAKVTGFAPQTPLATGLERFVDWYKSYFRPEVQSSRPSGPPEKSPSLQVAYLSAKGALKPFDRPRV